MLMDLFIGLSFCSMFIVPDTLRQNHGVAQYVRRYLLQCQTRTLCVLMLQSELLLMSPQLASVLSPSPLQAAAAQEQGERGKLTWKRANCPVNLDEWVTQWHGLSAALGREANDRPCVGSVVCGTIDASSQLLGCSGPGEGREAAQSCPQPCFTL